MKNKNLWINISIINLCIVALLGFILRSKILFSIPWVNYLNLLDTHSHFAFAGWVTLALLVLMVDELLPESNSNKPVYNWLFGGIVFCSLGILLVKPFNDGGFLSSFISYLLILISYLTAWIFLKDFMKTSVNKTVRLLGVSAILSLVLSSTGPILLSYLNAVKSLHPFYYRDALYIYLHLQYNGFFTLAAFALFFHKLYPIISKNHQKKFYWFSVLLCISILPSLFLSFLWQDPNNTFRIIAVTGSILILLSVICFVIASISLIKYFRMAIPSVRFILIMTMAAFILKMFLQSLTIFPVVGNAVFGDRPVIIGFLHLVFLGFVTPFILAWYVQENYLNIKKIFTVFALIIFILGIALNEMVLMLQGLGAMFLKSSYLFPWLLWVISILLVCGALMLFAARMKSKNIFQESARNQEIINV